MNTIICNWKLHKYTVKDTEIFVKDFTAEMQNFSLNNTDVVFCPHASLLHLFQDIIKHDSIHLGLQSIQPIKEQNATGAINAVVAKEFGCEYVIIGHQEERKIFNLSTESISQKVEYAIQNDLKPIVCFGETKVERMQNKTFDVLKSEIGTILSNVRASYADKIMFAYEPIWAIGANHAISKDDLISVTMFIKEMLNNAGFANSKILYGGSVNDGNYTMLMSVVNLDGALMGRSSVDLECLKNILSISK